MDKDEFELLRELDGKVIHANIEFRADSKTMPNLIFDQIVVENAMGYDLLLNGNYRPAIPSVTFNFVIKGQGPICRLDVNGTIHKESGRNHKHELQKSGDSNTNLPFAVKRDDLATCSTVKEIWETLCQEARISHSGEFIEPEGWQDNQ